MAVFTDSGGVSDISHEEIITGTPLDILFGVFN